MTQTERAEYIGRLKATLTPGLSQPTASACRVVVPDSLYDSRLPADRAERHKLRLTMELIRVAFNEEVIH